MRRIKVACIVGLGAWLSAAPASAQPLPSDLTGETLQATSAPTVTISCNPTGTSSGTFSVTGTAVGPYPGTFTESGSFSFGPLGGVNVPPQGPEFTSFGQMTTFNANFTITSGTTRITGTKVLGLFISPAGGAVGLTFTFGSCSDVNLPAGSTTVVDVAANTTYQATINEPAGQFADNGGAEVSFQSGTNPTLDAVLIGPSFQESFVLSGGVVALCNEDSQNNQNQHNQGCSNAQGASPVPVTPPPV